jgi:hypothetical protein
MKNYIINRLKEPSTWRGFIWVASAFGMALQPEQASAIVGLGALLAGSSAVVTPDRLFSKGDKNK